MSDDRTVPTTSTNVDLPDWLDEVASGQPRAAEPVEQRFSTFSIVGTLVIVLLLAVIGYALWERSQSQPTEGPAPTFEITVFPFESLDRSGEQFSLADLKGQTVVINFWASYCIPCQQEARMLERVYQDYKSQGVVFLGINTDDIESDARAYLAEYGVTYPNAPDQGGRIEDDYRITGIPETFIVNSDGEITRHFIAAVNERDLRSEIDRALG